MKRNWKMYSSSYRYFSPHTYYHTKTMYTITPPVPFGTVYFNHLYTFHTADHWYYPPKWRSRHRNCSPIVNQSWKIKSCEQIKHGHCIGWKIKNMIIVTKFYMGYWVEVLILWQLFYYNYVLFTRKNYHIYSHIVRIFFNQK